MKYEFRISKYNPAYRNSCGSYQRDEWTEYLDIGKTFNGIELTRGEYHRIERLYVNAAIMMLGEANVDKVNVENLEGRCLGQYVNGDIIETNHLAKLISGVLRNRFWCKIRCPRRAFIHFGYDYYMYVGLSILPVGTIKTINKSELYVESFNSPY